MEVLLSEGKDNGELLFCHSWLLMVTLMKDFEISSLVAEDAFSWTLDHGSHR